MGGVLIVNLILAIIYVNYQKQQNGEWRPLKSWPRWSARAAAQAKMHACPSISLPCYVDIC
eukprot:632362-Pelagomonas_calceolata.AAC.5